MEKQSQTSLSRKIYSVLIVLLYIGIGAYFIRIYFSNPEDSAYWLPVWSYLLFGLISILYGIFRLYRSLKK